MPNWIGDAVMATPALSALKEVFPSAEITVLIKPWASPVIKNHPAVSRVMEYKPDSPAAPLKRLRLVWEIRKNRFDSGILFTNSFDSALTFKAAGIPVICGYSTDARGMLLHQSFPVPETRGKRHEVYYYMELVRMIAEKAAKPFSACTFNENRPSLVINPDRDASLKTVELPGAIPAEKQGSTFLIGFNPGAAYGPAKCWPVEKFRILAKKIFLHMPGSRILIFGTDKEKAVGVRICEGMEDRCVNLTGKTTLSEVIALIKRLDLLVTNDSGLMHVGAGLGTPLVAIFGSTNPVTTGPWSDKSAVVRIPMECSPCLERRCPKSSFDCMNNISVEMVFNAMRKQLASFSEK